MNNVDQMFDYSHGVDNTYTVSSRHGLVSCIRCGQGSVVTLNSDEFFNYYIRGEHVQDAMPSLTVHEREHLLTGLHPDCWTELFGSDEQD